MDEIRQLVMGMTHSIFDDLIGLIYNATDSDNHHKSRQSVNPNNQDVICHPYTI